MVAVCAVSTSGPLIVDCAAPALAIAFWRNAMAAGLIAPVALVRCRPELRSMGRRERCLALAAGVLLAAHFGTWVPSLSYTSVASSTALVCMQPVWAGLFERVAGRRIPTAAWVGIALAVLGAGLLTGVDLTASSRALLGDGLALVGGVFSGAYIVVGGEVRRGVTTTAYTAICYGTTSVLLLAVCVVAGRPLTGYRALDWGLLAALTVGPQLLGHSVFNRVLRTTSPTVVALAILFEIPGAALIAAFLLGQHPSVAVIPALLLLVAGVAVVIRSSRSPARAVPIE